MGSLPICQKMGRDHREVTPTVGLHLTFQPVPGSEYCRSQHAVGDKKNFQVPDSATGGGQRL